MGRPAVSVLELVHETVAAKGWIAASARSLGLPDERKVVAALSPALVPDPRGPGKLHARDVVSYERAGRGICRECESVAHAGIDDFSRFRLADSTGFSGSLLAALVLDLTPVPLRKPSGLMSADYFRYSPGAGSAAHQDGFGDLVVIWVLDRSGEGGESFLQTPDGRGVMRGPLPAGSLLVFRDEMFLHGVTPMASGHRDALIFITLKDGA